MKRLKTYFTKKRILRYLLRYVLTAVVVTSCFSSIPKETRADYVTDYIGVKVGYAGKELSDYVLVGDYHISEIEQNLAIYEESYSFFQGNRLQPAKYQYIVDSARGFLVKDLLDYANIYYGDIYNLNFYVQDHNGIWCAFDRDALFAGNRYYFHDLPGHRKILYKTYKLSENGRKTAGAGGFSLFSALEEEPSGSEDPSEEPPSEEPPSEEPPSEEQPSEEPPSEEPPSEEPPSEEPPSEEPPSEEPPSEEPPSEEQPSEKPPSEEPPSEEPPSEEQPSEEPPSEEESSKEDPQEITDYSVILGYDFSECWNDCRMVQPMLAIEDNWKSYNEEFESAGEDFSYLNTSSRFRLLYGQYAPTDENTRDSAKYVRYVYVTLSGSPKFVEPQEKDKPKLETKIGSKGTIQVEVDNIYNEDMVNMLSEYMNLYSTNENVLVITDIRTEAEDGYSDRARVSISYEIVGEGEATIGGTFDSYHGDPAAGGNSLVALSETVTTGHGSGGNTGTEQGDPSQRPQNGADEKPQTVPQTNPQTDPQTDPQSAPQEETDPESQTMLPEEPQTTQADPETEEPFTTSASGSEEENPNAPEEPLAGTDDRNSLLPEQAKPETAAADLPETELKPAEQKVAEADLQTAEITQGKTMVYMLSDDLQKKLDALNQTEIVPVSDVPVTESVEELQIEDRTEEKKERQKQMLIYTGLGCLGLCLLGGVAEYAGFRFRLKRRLRKNA